MKKLLGLFLFSIVAAALSFAAEEGGPPAPSTPEETPPTALELKNKSGFALEESARNPFWPIGWKPISKVSNNEQAPDAFANAFLVSSITVDQGGRFAIINGKVMAEGQVFGLQMGNQTYPITVKAIQDGQVILQRRDQEIAVPLRRR